MAEYSERIHWKARGGFQGWKGIRQILKSEERAESIQLMKTEKQKPIEFSMIKDIKHNSDTVVNKIIIFKNGKAKKKKGKAKILWI